MSECSAMTTLANYFLLFDVSFAARAIKEKGKKNQSLEDLLIAVYDVCEC